MKAALIFAPALLALSLSATASASTPTSARPAATAPQDTIIIRLPNKVVMTLLVRDAAQLKQLKTYHLDSLTSRLGTYITQAEAAARNSKTERVTVEFYPDRDQPGQNLPEQVRITTSKSQANRNRVEVALNKRFGLTVTTDEKGAKNYDLKVNPDESGERRRARADSTRLAKERNRNRYSQFRFDAGLNALVNKEPYTTAPGLAPGQLELRPGGSRFINIGLAYAQRLGGKRSPVFLSLGPEFAFNNYMLQGNSRWLNNNGRTEVVGLTDGRELEKSKLATTTANVPLMLNLRVRNARGKPAFSLGAGGFVGYLLGEHTKVKYTRDGDSVKDKDRGAFNLNEFQYGVQGTLGLGSLTLFGKYNLNELFKEGRGPQTQVVSFGVQVFNVFHN